MVVVALAVVADAAVVVGEDWAPQAPMASPAPRARAAPSAAPYFSLIASSVDQRRLPPPPNRLSKMMNTLKMSRKIDAAIGTADW